MRRSHRAYYVDPTRKQREQGTRARILLEDTDRSDLGAQACNQRRRVAHVRSVANRGLSRGCEHALRHVSQGQGRQSGAGMGQLSKVLTPYQKVKLEHVRRGKESLGCLLESAKRSKGGLALAQEAQCGSFRGELRLLQHSNSS